MADKKVIGGTNITASQMKEFWRLVDGGAINSAIMQAFIENYTGQLGHILVVNRAIPFDPVAFLDKGWKIEEQDKRVLSVTEIDLDKVSFETCLKAGESWITGEEKLKRHATVGHVLADAKIGQVLYQEEEQRTLEYLYKEKGINWFELQGTILRDPHGRRSALYLCRRGWGWFWSDECWLDYDRYACHPSLVLTST